MWTHRCTWGYLFQMMQLAFPPVAPMWDDREILVKPWQTHTICTQSYEQRSGAGAGSGAGCGGRGNYAGTRARRRSGFWILEETRTRNRLQSSKPRHGRGRGYFRLIFLPSFFSFFFSLSFWHALFVCLFHCLFLLFLNFIFSLPLPFMITVELN